MDSQLLLRGMVVVTHDARDLPCSIFELPEVNELSFSYAFGILMAGMVKSVHAKLEHAVSLHVVDLQRARHEFARDFSADVVLDAVGQGRAAERDSSLIVKELYVFIDQRGELVQLALVVSVEQGAIEGRARTVEFFLILDLVEGRSRLRD